MPSSPQLDQHTDDILACGRKILALEASALTTLSRSLDERFQEAVLAIARLQGRVILTGVGKSGHIASKIAATMASTGTPAQFIHATEASHGDLGMIDAQDLVIALSHSGETRELSDIIQYTRRFTIPLIALTAAPDSTLAHHCDILLPIPAIPEAGAGAVAPTTSTTMMLALGDALALALWEHKGFSEETFSRYHPGGRLGQALRTADSLMHTGDVVPLVPLGMTMADAVVAMAEKPFGCIGVIDDNTHLQGIITDGDLRRAMDANFLRKTVQDCMSRTPYTAGPKTLVSSILSVMNQRRFGVAFILEDNRVAGIIHIHDIVRTGIL